MNAQNLVLNGNFSAGTTGPDNWSSWSANGGGDPNNQWPEWKNDAASIDGYYVQAGGGDWGDSAGWYQTVSVTEGVSYDLKVDSATVNWWSPEGKIGLVFKDASNNQLSNPTLVVANFQANLPWTTYTLSAVAPPNATQANIDLKFWGGGVVLFDNVSLTVVPEPGVAGLLTLGSALLIGIRSRRNGAGV